MKSLRLLAAASLYHKRLTRLFQLSVLHFISVSKRASTELYKCRSSSASSTSFSSHHTGRRSDDDDEVSSVNVQTRHTILTEKIPTQTMKAKEKYPL